MGVERQRFTFDAGVGGEEVAVSFNAKGFVRNQGAQRLILIARYRTADCDAR
jgi:hypothetical protein